MKVPKFKGFWNDGDGLTVSEMTIILIIPLYLYVAVKYAIASDLSPTQVDFFSLLTYPILAAIAKQAIERFGFPNLRRNNNGNYNNYNGYNGYYNDYGNGYDDNFYNNRGSGTQNNIIINKTNTDNYENRV